MTYMKNFGIQEALQDLGLEKKNHGTSTGSSWMKSSTDLIDSFSPVDGKRIGSVYATSQESYNKVIATAEEAFREWRKWPAPKRGEIVRQIGEALRKKKESLGKLV